MAGVPMQILYEEDIAAGSLLKAGKPIVVGAFVDAGRSATEVLVSAPDRPGLFADLCGALSARLIRPASWRSQSGRLGSSAQ
jgi:UTP:GlnB (protein PII) uridylyltransferase